jgi:hypothetical protein
MNRFSSLAAAVTLCVGVMPIANSVALAAVEQRTSLTPSPAFEPLANHPEIDELMYVTVGSRPHKTKKGDDRPALGAFAGLRPMIDVNSNHRLWMGSRFETDYDEMNFGNHVYLCSALTDDFDPSGSGAASGAQLMQEWHDPGKLGNAWLSWWTLARSSVQMEGLAVRMQGLCCLQAVINADGSFADVRNYGGQLRPFTHTQLSEETAQDFRQRLVSEKFRFPPFPKGTGFKQIRILMIGSSR